MKKRFEAFLREKNSLRELTVTSAGKPAVDAALIRKWQKKIHLLAMEGNETVALLLGVKQNAASVLLNSDRLDSEAIEGYLQNGLYLSSGIGNMGLLIFNRDEGQSGSGSLSAMASITTCFGLPIQWPDEELFGAICILHYPGKTLKPIYQNILLELRETIESALETLYDQAQAPKPAPIAAPAPAAVQADKKEDAVSPAPAPEIPQETPVMPKAEEPQPTPDTPVPAPKAAAPADKKQAEPEAPAEALNTPAPPKSDTDALTKIHSRKKIEELLKHEFDRAKRYFKTFSVTMLDLSDFKNINESFGRDAGDEILKAFAKSVGSKIRETDFWGRWGGDEFILVCPYADTVETQQMITRIKPLVTRDMKPVQGYSDFNFGVSQYEPDDLTYQAIIHKAEENMHQYEELLKRRVPDPADGQNAGSR